MKRIAMMLAVLQGVSLAPLARAQTDDTGDQAAPTESESEDPGATAATDAPSSPQASHGIAQGPSPEDTATAYAASLSPPPENSAVAGPRVEAAVEPATEVDDDDDDDDDSPMGWISLTFKLGYGRVNSGSMDNPSYDPTLAANINTLSTLYSDGVISSSELSQLNPRVQSAVLAAQQDQSLDELVTDLTTGGPNGACTLSMPTCTTPRRSGTQIALGIHLGGDGFGWDVEPYLLAASNAVAVGVYTGPKFDIRLSDPLFFGFGFGGKVAYVAADGWKYGADVFGRIPVHLTYYVLSNLAIEIEGSFGAGVSGYATDPKNYYNIVSAPQFKFGAARSWDLTVGVRFP